VRRKANNTDHVSLLRARGWGPIPWPGERARIEAALARARNLHANDTEERESASEEQTPFLLAERIRQLDQQLGAIADAEIEHAHAEDEFDSPGTGGTPGITQLPPEGMQLPGVALDGDAERGTKTTDGISLLFTTSGVTVQGPQPQIERLLVWSGLDSASCREKIQLPDGREAAIMELTSGGQSIRFLLPSDTVSPRQAAYLDQALPAWLARYGKAVKPVMREVAPDFGDLAATSGSGNTFQQRSEVAQVLPPVQE